LKESDRFKNIPIALASNSSDSAEIAQRYGVFEVAKGYGDYKNIIFNNLGLSE